MTIDNYHSLIGDPVEELKSTLLWKRLQELNPTRAVDACEFVRLINPILNNIAIHFPLYTRHDCHHGYEVIERMSNVIRPSLLQDSDEGFSDDEIFCLIIAAYAHDVGMALFEEGSERNKILDKLGLPYDVKPNNDQLCSFLRIHHADRGLQFLRSSKAGEHVPVSLKGLIGLIMKGHNLTPKELIDELPDEAPIGRKPSDPRALSIILCCADAIEFSDTRVIDAAYDEAKLREDETAKRSLVEMRKHRSIGCNLLVTKEGLIIAAGDFNDAHVLHATHSTLDQMEGWFKEYIIFNNRLKRPVLSLTNHAIIREAFTMDGFNYFPIAIKIDEYQIRELLTSQRLWGNEPGVPIRELVQNAVEACRYRKYISPMISDYKPLVEIIVDYEHKEITVSDNGCGMDEIDITEFFLQIGKSKSRDPKFKADIRNAGFDSIARFGVGFWSVFSIANMATVSSRIFSYDGQSSGLKFNVSINPVMRYLEMKNVSGIPVGTKIELKMKNDVDISRLVEDIRRYIMVGAVPIVIKDSNSKIIHEYDTTLKTADLEDVFGYRSKHAESVGISWFHYEVDDEDIEFRIGFAYSQIDGEYRCLMPDGNSLFNLVPQGRGFIEATSVCGFNTRIDFSSVPFAIGRVGVLNVNVKTSKNLIYSFNRLSLDENERYKEIQDKIRRYIADSLCLFYKKLGITGNAEKINILISDSRSNGGEAGDSRIPGLYDNYVEYFKKMVPISVLLWEKDRFGNIKISAKTIFIDEFWRFDKSVPYVCIWPSPHAEANIVLFIRAIVISSSEQSGYILLASHEASAIIDVANSAMVKTTDVYYNDWSHEKNQYIEILPQAGCGKDEKFLMKLSSKWSGDVSSLDFDRTSANKPWMAFGRSRMFVDLKHDLIKKLVDLYLQGHIWETGNLLSLMAAEDESCLLEIERLTGIYPRY